MNQLQEAIAGAFNVLVRSLAHSTVRLVLFRYRPTVVGITGAVGKTSIKRAAAKILSGAHKVRSAPEGIPVEFAIPMAIVGDWLPVQEDEAGSGPATDSGQGSWEEVGFWFGITLRGLRLILRRRSDYPEILIMEYPGKQSGEIKKMLRIVKPNIAVVTNFGSGTDVVRLDDTGREAARLVESLSVSGFAVLNGDDVRTIAVAKKTRAQVITFGFNAANHIRAANFEHKVRGREPVGVSFRLDYGGSSVPVKIDGVFGKSQAYLAAAGAGLGVVFGVHLIEATQKLLEYRPPKRRMNLKYGIRGTYILDDTVESSPVSLRVALETLKDLPGKRKVAILGDMLGLGIRSIEEHEAFGKLLYGVADSLITIGQRAKFIAESAKNAKFPKSAIWSFNEVNEETIATAQRLMVPGDLVLVKGSAETNMRELVDRLTHVASQKMEPEFTNLPPHQSIETKEAKTLEPGPEHRPVRSSKKTPLRRSQKQKNK